MLICLSCACADQYGLPHVQTTKIGQLSEGQKSRLVFGMICMQRPNLLLLDEPTNHLDIESIDALADAIKAFNGGLVLVSHDFRLIDQVSHCHPASHCVMNSPFAASAVRAATPVSPRMMQWVNT